MFIDSHCHLNFPELAQRLPEVLANMHSHQVTHALCISVTLDQFPQVLAVAQSYKNIFASVGVHPDYQDTQEPSVAELVGLADHAKIIAIGETGLDYYRLNNQADQLDWQRERFRRHIRAAREIGKPLVVHTRCAAADTVQILREEKAQAVGGVMHCFSESWEVAQAAIDLGFMISFSGIVTFKNARELHEVARRVALEHMLIETDAPYLAPVPLRGKTNEPAYVAYVAARIAQLQEVSVEQVAKITSDNFFKLFRHATR